jgi:transposase
MLTPSALAIAALELWLAEQPPLGRVMAEPMVAMVSQVMTTLQGSVEAAESRVDATESRMAEMQSANKDLQQQLAAVVTRVTTLEQKPFVPKSERKRKSERVPDPRQVARKRARTEMTPEEKAERRKAAADKRQAVLDGLDTFTVTVSLPPGLDVATSFEPYSRLYYEWQPGRLVKVDVLHERGLLDNGVLVTAPLMPEVADGGIYGPALYSKIAVDKVLNSMPLRRQERAFKTLGAPLPVSSLCTMFHRGAELISPLYQALLAHVRHAEHIQADETSLPVLDDDQVQRGWMWVFATSDALLFVHSESRGNTTPKTVLGDTNGTLVVDGYTAYHSVTGDNARARGGCWSHARRGLYDAKNSNPAQAQAWIDQIDELFYIEELAGDDGICGTTAHAKRRTEKSAPIVTALLQSIDTYIQTAPDTNSALYKAAKYIQNQAGPLQLFLTEPQVPIHNNLSERALRIVALLRKNSLFAGHHEAAQRYAQLLSLLSTCRLHDVDPERWLADVLIEVQRPVKGRVAEDLLPWNWKRDRGKVAKPLFDLTR